ncbi:hypothetical protein [Caminicella sporogenes]|nr:hypothetical protein [Caminicella sporogenes]WIF95993.1 hypothetical protein QNI18_05325 [Caminicella sporogenes]
MDCYRNDFSRWLPWIVIFFCCCDFDDIFDDWEDWIPWLIVLFCCCNRHY